MKRVNDALRRLLERFTLSEVTQALGEHLAGAEGDARELVAFGTTLKAMAVTAPVLRYTMPEQAPGLRPEPWADLVRTGLLFEINRAVLHPFGLALRVTEYDAEEGGGVEFDGLVSTTDPEGIVFDDGSLEAGAKKLAVFLRDTGREKLAAREKALGWTVQPVPYVILVDTMGAAAFTFAERLRWGSWGPDGNDPKYSVRGPAQIVPGKGIMEREGAPEPVRESRTAEPVAPGTVQMLRCLGKEVPKPEGWSVIYQSATSDDDPAIVTGDPTNKPPLPPGWKPPVWNDALDWWESYYIGTEAPASGTNESAQRVEHERSPADEAAFGETRFRYRRFETRSFSVTGSRVFAEFDICTQTQEGAAAVDALRRDAESGAVGWLATRCGDPEARCGWATIGQWPADTAHDGEDASFTFEIHADEQTAREHSRHRHGVQRNDTAQTPSPGLHAWLRGLLDLVSGFYGPPVPADALNRKMAALDDGLRAMEQRSTADVMLKAFAEPIAAELDSPQTVEISNGMVDLAKNGVTVSQDKIRTSIGLSENKPTDPTPEQPLVPGTTVTVPHRWHLAPVFPGDRPAIHYFGTKAPMLTGDWSTPVSGGIAGLWVSFYTGARSGTHSGEALLQDATRWAERPPTPRSDAPPSPHHAEHDHVGEVVDMGYGVSGIPTPETTGGAALLDIAAEQEPPLTDPPPASHFEVPGPPAATRTRLQGTVNEQTVTFVNPQFGDGYLLANIEASPLNWRSGALVTLHIPARMTTPRECRIHAKGGFWVFTWMPEKVVSLGVAAMAVKAGEMVALESTNAQVSAQKGERIVLRYGKHVVDAWLDKVVTKPNLAGEPERLYRFTVTLLDGPRAAEMMDTLRAEQGSVQHEILVRQVRDLEAIGPIWGRAVVWPGKESTSTVVTFLESPQALGPGGQKLRAWLAEREDRPAANTEPADPTEAPTPRPAPQPIPLMRQAPYITLADLETRVPRAVLIRCLEWGVEQKLSADLPQVQTLCEDASQQFDAMIRAHGGTVDHLPPAVVKRLVADLALLILQTRNPGALATRGLAQIDAEITTMIKASRGAEASGGIKSLLDLVHDERLDAPPPDSEPPDSYDGVPDSALP